jgi:CheY-like chemotaxis protein
MTEDKKILVAESDKKVAAALKNTLKARGYEVVIATDGPTALNKAISEMPGMTILSVDLPSIDGIKLSQILRSNPRTEPIPIIFLSESDIQIAHFHRHRDSLFIKPINADEVAARVYSYFGRVEKTKEVSKEGKMIEGGLSEISLPDLLQMFHMNRKEGRLSLINNSKKGDVFIHNGNIVDAALGEVEGEKAMFRLLTWREGRFKFLPTNVTVPQKITRPTDSLIMEGLRQFDEWESLKDKFPPMDAHLNILIDPSTLPKGLRPITQEIFLLLEFYSRVSDIIDRNTFPDYEVMRTVMTLLNKGIIGIAKEKGREARPILPKEDVIRLKERLAGHKNYKLDMESGKVLIFSSDNDRVRYIMNAMNTLPEFYIHPDFLKGMGPNPYLGAGGCLQISESIQINFIVVPLSERFSPLWRPLSNSMLCGISILNGEAERWEELKKVCRYFHLKLDKPMAFAIPEGEVSEDKAREVREHLELKKEALLFSVIKNDPEGVRSMLGSLFQSILGTL